MNDCNENTAIRYIPASLFLLSFLVVRRFDKITHIRDLLKAFMIMMLCLLDTTPIHFCASKLHISWH